MTDLFVYAQGYCFSICTELPPVEMCFTLDTGIPEGKYITFVI